jgi:hypothetical protein
MNNHAENGFGPDQGFSRSENPSNTPLNFTKVHLDMTNGALAVFASRFQKGVRVQVTVGCHLEDLLCRQLGLEPAYLQGRVQTIFLDGKPVDDLERAMVTQGALVSLSAAMPGLVGATMRKGGYYASLRRNITDDGGRGAMRTGPGSIIIKLFNLLIHEVGPILLKRGIVLSAQERKEIAAGSCLDFWENCLGAWLNGRRVKVGRLIDDPNWSGGGDILLSIELKN